MVGSINLQRSIPEKQIFSLAFDKFVNQSPYFGNILNCKDVQNPEMFRFKTSFQPPVMIKKSRF